MIEDWDAYLLAESGLPGPRANLELAHTVAEIGDEERFLSYLSLSPEEAPTNSPAVFLAVCGAMGLGRLVAEGRRDLLDHVGKPEELKIISLPSSNDKRS
jgi:hypothetical protein